MKLFTIYLLWDLASNTFKSAS